MHMCLAELAASRESTPDGKIICAWEQPQVNKQQSQSFSTSLGHKLDLNLT